MARNRKLSTSEEPVEPEPEAEGKEMQPMPGLINTTQETPAPATMAEQPEETPFDEMMRREYELALDQEISKGIQKINRRATALMSQESSITDVIVDALGHDADWYEDLVLAVQNKDPRVGQTKEDVYNYLADLGFTEMKPIENIKKMYPMTD